MGASIMSTDVLISGKKPLHFMPVYHEVIVIAWIDFAGWTLLLTPAPWHAGPAQ